MNKCVTTIIAAVVMIVSTSAFAGPDRVNSLDDPDYIKAQDEIIKMSPEAVRDFGKKFLEYTSAIRDLKNQPYRTSPTLMFSNDPVSKPPVIKLAFNYTTWITVLDATGAPWPIVKWVIGNSSLFEHEDSGALSHIMHVWPKTTSGQTNLTFILKGEDKPRTATLIAGTGELYDIPVIKIQKKGPEAKLKTFAHSYKVNDKDELLESFLTLTNSSDKWKESTIKGSKFVRAWTDGKNTIVRSKYPLLDPAYTDDLYDSSNLGIFYIPSLPTLLTFSIDGSFKDIEVVK